MGVMKRVPLSLLAAVLLTLVGAAGLLRGAVPLRAQGATGGPAGSSATGGAVAPTAPMALSGGYVREPANEVNAAAYFTIYNNTDWPDVLRTVACGAGAETSLHVEQGGSMKAVTDGLSIPAHGSVVLSPGKGHLMIEQLYGPLKAGQTVNFEFTFDKAGRLLATVPVIEPGSVGGSTVAPPTSTASTSTGPSSTASTSTGPR